MVAVVAKVKMTVPFVHVPFTLNEPMVFPPNWVLIEQVPEGVGAEPAPMKPPVLVIDPVTERLPAPGSVVLLSDIPPEANILTLSVLDVAPFVVVAKAMSDP